MKAASARGSREQVNGRNKWPLFLFFLDAGTGSNLTTKAEIFQACVQAGFARSSARPLDRALSLSGYYSGKNYPPISHSDQDLACRWHSRRYRYVGKAKQMPTRKMAIKCQTKPFIFNLRDSTCIQIVHAVAVIMRSQLNPEITQVANGAAKNSGQATSPRNAK